MSRRRRYRYRSHEDDAHAKKKRLIKEVILWVLTVAIALTAAWYVSFHLLDKSAVIGDSMSPTLEENDIILIGTMAYRFTEPERFDVIVFKQSSNEHSYYDVKRVIGLPGETVLIDDDGIIWINGERLKEEILVETISNSGLAEEGITLDDGEYFVLGDNRNHSEDSRFANVGNVLAGDIVGEAWIKLEPFTLISQINRMSQESAEEKGE